jgi:hypothetical protein
VICARLDLLSFEFFYWVGGAEKYLKLGGSISELVFRNLNHTRRVAIYASGSPSNLSSSRSYENTASTLIVPIAAELRLHAAEPRRRP